jgi:hypothetical protein
LLVGAVIELSSSEVARAAAAAVWMLTYERAKAIGLGSAGSRGACRQLCQSLFNLSPKL